MNSNEAQYPASTKRPISLKDNLNPWSKISDNAPYVAIVMLTNLDRYIAFNVTWNVSSIKSFTELRKLMMTVQHVPFEILT